MKRLVQILCAVVLFSSLAQAAEQSIKVVGSSTVYPFTTVVAERFGKDTKYGTPIVESTGTGGGMKLFCAGIGINSPSVTNASRAIKAKEVALCEKNGVSFVEFKVGNDGIAFANSVKGPKIDVTKEQLWQAMALLGPQPKKWSDIDPSLPNYDIKIMTPPPTSGTRDAWNSLVMKKGCPADILKEKGKKACYQMREDGGVIEVGENDTLLINKMGGDKQLFAIFGFSYLDSSRDKVQAAKIEGSVISLDSIQSYDYPIARPLFIYFKKEHMDVVPGLKKFMKTYISKKAMGPRGYLMDLGLVPLDKATFKEMKKRTKLK
jgi:phosphate transport system substrate-binding protein